MKVIDTLTPSERAILRVLVKHRGEIVSAAVLIVDALGYKEPGPRPANCVSSHIRSLRVKHVKVKTSRKPGASGYYVGTLPPPPPREPQTYTAACQWCSAEFTEPAVGHPRFRYCPEHRARMYRQALSLLRTRGPQ